MVLGRGLSADDLFRHGSPLIPMRAQFFHEHLHLSVCRYHGCALWFAKAHSLP